MSVSKLQSKRRPTNGLGKVASLKRPSQVRPYTQFSSAGLYPYCAAEYRLPRVKRISLTKP
jgi:hypothetical protein